MVLSGGNSTMQLDYKSKTAQRGGIGLISGKKAALAENAMS